MSNVWSCANEWVKGAPKWNTIWHKAKAQKEATFLWSVIHKAMAINEWHSKISVEIDQSCSHCGPQLIKLVEHMLYNCPLAHHVWRYAANIIWQFFAKTWNLGLGKSFSMLQCFYINSHAKHIKGSFTYGSSWEAVFHGSFGGNEMTQFLINCNGPLRKHVKSFGMPCRVTEDWMDDA